MAQTAKKKSGARTSGKRHGPGEAALERLHDSLEAAQSAVKEVRSELGRGSKELLKDVETTVRDARKNLRGVSRRVSKELGSVQETVRGKRPTPSRSSKATTQRKASPRKSTRSSARRTTKR